MNVKSTKVAVVRVSPKAGNVKHLWIYEERANGWIQGGPEQTYSPTFASWHAPQHILKVVDIGTVAVELGAYDWNGIQPGTLVDLWGGSQKGVVTGRRGTKYDVLLLGSGRPIEVPWWGVVPVVLEDETDATA